MEGATILRSGIIFRDLKNGFCLVVEFRSNMSSCVVVALVEVKHGLYMNIHCIRSPTNLVASVELLMSSIKSRMPSMTTKPTLGVL